MLHTLQYLIMENIFILYAIFAGVAAYNILKDGDLELINVLSINGMRGCHIALTKNDDFLIVSGYMMEKSQLFLL